LDKELFEACLGSGEKYGEVDADYDYGVSLGVTGTPTFFINGQKVQNWNYASMAAIIDAELGS
jgi:protein-disulfide isomerase